MRAGLLERPDGAAIHYEVTGDGPPLVFAHGLGGNHMSWWQQVPHFAAAGFTCVAFAHRGFAPSTPLPDGPDPRDYAGDLAALLDHLGLGEVAVVAQSMGGWAATGLALADPGRVRAMVLACTSGVFRPEFDGAEAWRREADARRAALLGAGIHPACGERMAREQPALHHLYRQIDALAARHLDKEALRRRLHAARDQPPERLATLPMPILFLTGAEDPVFPSAAGAALAAQAPRGRSVVVPEAGHSVYFERAALFNRVVGEFLAGVT
jgi:3-oxoadipate enol-lactonase